MSHAMQVLALLEERPFDPRELAGVLATPLAIIEQTLHALRQAGSVKTVGSAKKWTLITTAPGLGGRPAVNRDAEILQLLTGGPLASGAIGEAVHLSHSPVIRRLQKLRTQGHVKSFGRGRFTQWALPAYVVPASSAAAPRGSKASGPRLPAEPAWWTAFAAPGSDRAAFSAEVERRHHARLQQQKPGAGIQHWKSNPPAALDIAPPDVDDTLVVDPDLEEPADA